MEKGKSTSLGEKLCQDRQIVLLLHGYLIKVFLYVILLTII